MQRNGMQKNVCKEIFEKYSKNGGTYLKNMQKSRGFEKVLDKNWKIG